MYWINQYAVFIMLIVGMVLCLYNTNHTVWTRHALQVYSLSLSLSPSLSLSLSLTNTYSYFVCLFRLTLSMYLLFSIVRCIKAYMNVDGFFSARYCLMYCFHLSDASQSLLSVTWCNLYPCSVGSSTSLSWINKSSQTHYCVTCCHLYPCCLICWNLYTCCLIFS